MANDLARHFVAGPGHDALAFHRGCPTCRQERLVGCLSNTGAAGRATAGIAALALLATPVSPAFAGPDPPAKAPDQDYEGTTDSGDPTTFRAQPDPVTLIPSGDETIDADSDEPPVDDGFEGPVEPPPPPDVVGSDETNADSPAPQPPPVSGPPGPPPVAPPPSANVQPAPPHSAPLAPQAAPQEKSRKRTVDDPPHGHPRPRPAAPKPSAGLPRRHSVQPSQRSSELPPPVTYTTASRLAPPTDGGRRAPSSPKGAGSKAATHEIHVITPGETLWSIASERVGSHANVAAIAREVQRLWELNATRIGTGSPDLVRAGQTINLR